MTQRDPLIITGQGDWQRADDPETIALWRILGLASAGLAALVIVLHLSSSTVNTRGASPLAGHAAAGELDRRTSSPAAHNTNPTNPKPPTSPAGLASASPAAVGGRTHQETR